VGPGERTGLGHGVRVSPTLPSVGGVADGGGAVVLSGGEGLTVVSGWSYSSEG
jgi:hypothetical protein